MIDQITMITRDPTEVNTSNKAKNLKLTPSASSNAPTPIWNGSGGSSSRRLKDPRIVRTSPALGGKDRHSKVYTAKGLRDRRVRLSVPTAIQLYDLQDRLGLNQPSKVVDWLLNVAKQGIDELPPLQFPQGLFTHHFRSLLEPSKPIVTSKSVSTPAGESGVYNNPFLVNPNLGLICPPSQTLGSTVPIDCGFTSLAQLPLSGSHNNFQLGISTQPCLPPQIFGNNSTTRSNGLFDCTTKEMVSFSSFEMSNSLPVYQFGSQGSAAGAAAAAAAAVVRPIFPFTMSPNTQKPYSTGMEQNKGRNKFLS